MSKPFCAGSRVKWNWGQDVCRGRIAGGFETRVEWLAEGAPIGRNGSRRDLAFLILSDRGAQVLKLASELSVA